MRRPTHYVSTVLKWADTHFKRTGRWPGLTSGRVWGTVDEKWVNINACLREGHRGFPGGWTLAQLLFEYRGKRNDKRLPHYTISRILQWVDAHFKRTGKWPNIKSGAIHDAPGETWLAVHMALHKGRRGLTGGSSLAELLANKRNVRNRVSLPRLTVTKILRWADAHRRRTGNWPTITSCPVTDAPSENWKIIDGALRAGSRGLRGGSSLFKLLVKHRKLSRHVLKPLAISQILVWADDHFRRTGRWPSEKSGRIPQSSGGTWQGVQSALRQGGRGVRKGSSIRKLLVANRGVPSRTSKLSIRQILRWADDHYRRAGRWPNEKSGAIPKTAGETWCRVRWALKHGQRGMSKGLTIGKLLAMHRGVRNRQSIPKLTVRQILRWADAFFSKHGTWPSATSGAIDGAPGESWQAINVAIKSGGRGLPGGSTLAKLLFVQRNRPLWRREAIPKHPKTPKG